MVWLGSLLGALHDRSITNETGNLRIELYRRMMFSRKVFWGATSPRRPPGILLASHLISFLPLLFSCYGVCFEVRWGFWNRCRLLRSRVEYLLNRLECQSRKRRDSRVRHDEWRENRTVTRDLCIHRHKILQQYSATIFWWYSLEGSPEIRRFSDFFFSDWIDRQTQAIYIIIYSLAFLSKIFLVLEEHEQRKKNSKSRDWQRTLWVERTTCIRWSFRELRLGRRFPIFLTVGWSVVDLFLSTPFTLLRHLHVNRHYQ